MFIVVIFFTKPFINVQTLLLFIYYIQKYFYISPKTFLWFKTIVVCHSRHDFHRNGWWNDGRFYLLLFLYVILKTSFTPVRDCIWQLYKKESNVLKRTLLLENIKLFFSLCLHIALFYNWNLIRKFPIVVLNNDISIANKSFTKIKRFLMNGQVIDIIFVSQFST